MGQKIGKVALLDVAQSFSNLPKRAILHLWQVFNNIADGFGVRVDELEEICIDLKDELNISRVAMVEKIKSLFKCLDTDENGLIDALEFFSCIAVLSGMKKRAIMEFILTVYDFDGTEALSMDEVVLALKSVSAGLCKLQPSHPNLREKIVLAKEEQIEQLVSEIYSSQCESGGEVVDDSVRLNIKILASLLIAHPDVSYWFSFFSAPAQVGLPTYELTWRDLDFKTENPVVTQTAEEQLAIDWNVRCEEDDDDQSGGGGGGKSAKPAEQWKSAVALLTPVEYATTPLKRESPNCSIFPEWIYGYQSEKCKGNLHYTFKGDLVYNISKYAVIYSVKLHQQRIFSGHTNEILSLQMHPSKEIVATGEVASNSTGSSSSRGGGGPRLLVWHTDTLKILYSYQGFHQNGITQISFSPDGRVLASVGNDAQQSISVCLWESGTILFTSPVAPTPCLACTVLAGNTIVAAGDSYLSFWSYYAEGYVRRRGNFSRFTAQQPITSLSAIFETENLVAGTASGLLLLWVDVNCIRSVKAHNGTVNALYSCAHGLLSGGKDERIRMWTATLEPSFTFDVSHYGINPCVRSLCMAADGTSILMGAKGANIYEISAIDGSDLRGGPIAVGHSYGELCCVATHPSKFEFLTVGQDHTLRVFDMGTNTQLKIATFDGEARTVSYNPLGDIIVVGFAGTSVKAGAYVVLNEEDLSVVHEAKDSSCAISLVAFSPEGETLAVGCVDGSIYLYAVHDDYELVGKCERHTSPITYIDFSKDGEWLRSNSADRELFFFNTDDASFQSNVASMRDVQWATFFCTYSWHVKESRHSAYLPADEVVCNQSLPIPEEMEEAVEPFLASGTSEGYLRLYAFPCAAAEGMEGHRYPAHCSSVAQVRFSFGGERLVSAGLKDRCIIQWRCLPYPADSEAKQPDEGSAAAGDGDRDLRLEMASGAKLLEEFMPATAQLPIGLINAAPRGLVAGGKKLPLPPPVPASPENDVWLASVVEPTAPPTVRTQIPQLSLILEHVYGYECQTMRNNVRYTATDEIVYVVSTLGVVMSTANKAQRIYKYHSDAISSFACARDGSLVATGQLGHRPTVSVWDAKRCITRFVVPEQQLNAVACLAFSQNNELLAVVNMDKDHTISIYDWKANIAVGKAYGGLNHILGMFFTDTTDGANSGYGLVTYGAQELKFWRNVASRFPTAVRPRLGELGVVQNFLCGEPFQGRPTIGTSDGYIYIFADNSLKKTVKAHSGPLTAMDICVTKKLLVTGGRDGAVRVWGSDYSCSKEFVLDSILDTVTPSVRSVAFNATGTQLVVGTRGAEIFEISIVAGAKVGDKDKSLVQSHGVRQLWGLASHPTREECVTSGDDATLRVWDTKNYIQKKVLKMDTASRAICYSPDGKLIAIGFGSGKRSKGKLAPKEGAFTILRAADFKVVHEAKDSNSAIRVVKFSPDYKTFAVASDDNNIYTYNMKDEYSRRSTISCHEAPVMYLDFSAEGNYIVSVDAARRVCYTESNTGVSIPTPEALRDEKWMTTTSPYMWAAQGLWPSLPPGTRPVAVQKSWGGMLLAAGSDAGSVTVAHNPYPRRAGFVQCHGHAGGISAVSWVAGDGALLTVGVKDHALMQWKCMYEGTRESGDEGGRSCDDSEIEIDGGHELVKTHMHPVPAVGKGGAGGNAAAAVAPPPTPLVPDILPSVAAAEAAAAAEEGLSPEEAAAKKKAEQEEERKRAGTLDEQSDNWYAKICAPSNIEDDDQRVPDTTFELDFAHGARLGDCRKLLRYNEDGKALYAVASVAVIFDRKDVTQLYYLGHKHAIISLEVNQVGKIVATGEQAEFPELHVWDAKTGNNITKFENIHRQGITSVSFSNDSEYLISLGQDVCNSLVVCHSPSRTWTDGYVMCSTSISSAKMLWCLYSESSSMYPIVVGGTKGNVFFFRVVRGATERVKGVYGKRHKIQPMLCALEAVVSSSIVVGAAAAGGGGGGSVVSGGGGGNGALGLPSSASSVVSQESGAVVEGKSGADGAETTGSVVGGSGPGATVDAAKLPAVAIGSTMNVMLCGTVTGYIYIFYDTKVMNKVAAHDAPVNAICSAGKNFLTAGKEGKVKLWSPELKLLHTFSIPTYLPRPYLFSCHNVTCNRQGTSFMVGQRSGEVFEVSLQSHSYVQLGQGHAKGEQHALDVSPVDADEYATAGDDGVVMVWSVARRYCLRSVRVEAASRALAWSPSGELIIVGFGAAQGNTMGSKDGAFMVLDAKSLEIVREERRAKQSITDIKFAPGDSELLALTSSDGRVYLHGTKKFDLKWVVETPVKSCSITKIDFSSDGNLLRMCTNVEQLFFYSVETVEMLKNPTQVRDVQWGVSPSCHYTWLAQGVFRRGSDGVQVSAVAVHPTSQRVIAASYANGDVRVYRYPCQSQQGAFLVLPGVASEATRLKFSVDGRFLIVTDCKTRAILQFRVTVPPPPPTTSSLGEGGDNSAVVVVQS